MFVDFNEEDELAKKYDLSTTEGQLVLLFGPGLGFYPDPNSLTDVARFLEARLAKKGSTIDDCDVYTIYPEIIRILREASQLSIVNKGE
jgi:hypothetical protein